MKLINTPRSIDACITNKCNLRCLYCSHFTSHTDVEVDLPKEEWLTFFEELGRNGVMNVALCGGEPFIRSDLKDLIDGVVRNRMRYSILTNGTLVTEKIAEFIASTKRCDAIQVSIDGSTPITHDACRGKGTFDRAIQGLLYLKKYNIPLTVRVTIHKGNVRDLDDIAKLLLEEIGLQSFSTNAASYMGLCRKNSELVQLGTEERMIAMKSLVKLAKKYQGRVNSNAGPLSEARAWVEMEQAYKDGASSFTNCGYLTGCNGAYDKLAVRSDGIIIPCQQLSYIELGRINQNDLKDIWQNSLELKKLRERNKIPLTQFEFCKDCKYVPYCTGNCPALAYTLTGDAYQPSPDACLRRFIEDGGSLQGIF